MITITGPLWAVELTADGKHVGFLSGKTNAIQFVVVFTDESRARRAISDNGHGTRNLIHIQSPTKLAEFVASIAKAGLGHVGIDSGVSEIVVLPIVDVLKSIRGALWADGK